MNSCYEYAPSEATLKQPSFAVHTRKPQTKEGGKGELQQKTPKHTQKESVVFNWEKRAL